MLSHSLLTLRGLSPRVRGNLGVAQSSRDLFGSIPACAGEPWRGIFGRRVVWVYPRVCGGTRYHQNVSLDLMGLSPRVRGNRARKMAALGLRRSIPACAGEPNTDTQTTARGSVYPRVCGGTSMSRRSPSGLLGLSPRVRGNRWNALGWQRPRGSIPACAGEPRMFVRPMPMITVYPRVCGGTASKKGLALSLMGLSPRVRGNHVNHVPGRNVVRSIPACAGEPPAGPGSPCPSRVYPRVCGGTFISLFEKLTGLGLSPRVRGNPGYSVQYKLTSGSIPACAGEPPSSR